MTWGTGRAAAGFQHKEAPKRRFEPLHPWTYLF